MKTRFIMIAATILGSSAFAQTNWTEKFSFKGDFRLRGDFEQTESATVGDYERNRLRFRARLLTTAKVNDNTDAILRFATGNTAETGANTTNQDMTDYASKKGLNLDMAYINWRPNDTAQIWIGKSPVVYYQPGNSDMLFDSDLTPEGISYRDGRKGESIHLFWNLGYWIIDEFNATPRRVDITAVGGDLGVTFQMGDVGMTIGGGILNFANIEGASALVGGSGASFANGNTTASDAFVNKYELTRGFLEISAPLGEAPIALYFDYVQNQDPSDENKGNLVGIKYGKLKDIGSWTIALDRRDLENDATLGLFAESDTGGGGAGLIANRLALGYQLADATALNVHYSMAERRNDAEADYQRAMVDLIYNF